MGESAGKTRISDGEKKYQEVITALADYVLRTLENEKINGGMILQPETFSAVVGVLIPILERER